MDELDSILTSVKKVLGIAEEYTHFDADLILHINSVFTILNQLGVGPDDGFYIENADAVWSDFISEDENLELVKSYMCRKVRLMFDPPLSSAVIEVMKEMNREDEWRLQVAADKTDEEE